jgi:hypothetical protein
LKTVIATKGAANKRPQAREEHGFSHATTEEEKRNCALSVEDCGR